MGWFLPCFLGDLGGCGVRLFALTLVAMLAFAGNSVLTRMAVGAGAIDAQSFALVRLVAGAVMLAGLMGARRVAWPGWSGRAAGVAGLLVYLFGFSLAYVSLAAGTGALVLFGMVQITMFAGALIGGEVVRPARWAGAALAFGGLVWLVAPGLSLGAFAPMLAMGLAGVGWGIYSLAGRRAGDALAATGANFILAVPFAVLIWALQGAAHWELRGVVLAVISGAVTSGLGYALWYRLLPHLGASRAAVAQLSVPMLAATAGIALGEPMSVRFVVAAALVLGGVAVASR
jgi:drug/metabolite transporter (DMT)-like permease